MDRVFLDANVLFSAAYREGAGVARLWQLSDVALLTSEYAVEEARRNLPDARQLQRLATLLDAIEVTPARNLEEHFRAGIELPEKDWPILGGAVAANATHLVTGDLRDFGRYFGTKLLGVLVLRPAEYLGTRS